MHRINYPTISSHLNTPHRTMENVRMHNEALITQSYLTERENVRSFIGCRINNNDDADDLTQTVWLRLLEYNRPLSPDSLAGLIYKIARNLVNDYLRHHYRVTEAHEEIRNTAFTAAEIDEKHVYSMESEIYARELAQIEHRRVECMPPQRRIIYVMNRYQSLSAPVISERLQLSVRTVENHLRMGRNDVRSYLSAIA
ncbi:sigma-70 family RNA polymerase sigma factor [uncultured Duncaniella sp.]|uniref:sigma-70 family RNA polymerase sigma factor n=1 Tax=uncultured Duncaniella sp. TaxID=2768039 RepID=UPI00267526A0|nr:sigma-70 family RNA polymerase sigma factor [uncultured Duncaniella sp.]